MGTANNIKKLRKMFGITQDQLAEIAGVSKQAVSSWELGLKEPRMGAIEKIVQKFGLKKSNLIEDGGMDNLDLLYNKSKNPDDPLTKEIMILIEQIKKLSPEKQEVVIKTLRMMLD